MNTQGGRKERGLREKRCAVRVHPTRTHSNGPRHERGAPVYLKLDLPLPLLLSLTLALALPLSLALSLALAVCSGALAVVGARSLLFLFGRRRGGFAGLSVVGDGPRVNGYASPRGAHASTTEAE